jgi:two-component system sensor histidine kinase MtrB
VTRTELPSGGTEEVLASPEREKPSGSAAELRRIRRGLRRRSVRARRRAYVLSRRVVTRAVHAWRSSLQVRIGAITMVVAGTVVVIVSLVLFSQIRDQLLTVKRQAAIDQAQAGVSYAQTQVTGIATGDAVSVRSALSRTVTQLVNRGGSAGDFDVVMIYRTGDIERAAARPARRRRGRRPVVEVRADARRPGGPATDAARRRSGAQ